MKQVLVVTIVVLCLGAVVFALRERILLAMGDFLIVQDDLRPADVIHVIAGSDYRTDYAIQLYKQGYGKQIFFTGGWCTLHDYYHGQHGQAYALEQGVPAEAIAFDDSEVMSTYAEVVRLKEFIAHSQTPIRSIMVVSDPYHMRRARLIYRWVLGERVRVWMAPVPFDLTPFQRHWWADEASRQYVRNEYLKIVYYYARYQLSWGPVRDWLASLDRD